MRRLLLGLVIALVVARPLVLGEDPGLLNPLTGSASLALALFWLLAAVGWALWRVFFRQGTWYASGVEAGLLGVVGLLFVSAAWTARYQHPAWLIAWEWVVLLVAFCLVRQLVRTADDNRGLLAAILATAVSLAAYAAYQYVIELPSNRALLDDPEELRQELARQQVFVNAGDPQLDMWRKRILMNNVFATFAHPNTFAGYLALLLPAAVGLAAVGWRRQPRSGYAWATAGCAVLLALALWLTHSRGALLGVVVAGVAVAAAYVWRLSWRVRVWFASGVAGLTLLFVAAWWAGWLSSGFGKDTRSASSRLDYWSATWDLIGDHPWLGVGPGNFGREYPRHMLPTAYEKLQDPHNFALEMWVSCGVFGLLALLIALAAFFRRTRAAWRIAAGPPAAPPSLLPLDPSQRWTFYLGGAAGLLFALLLRAFGEPGENIIREAVASGVRSVIWFLAFALFDSIPWTGPSRTLALTAGVLALLVNLTVSGGIGFPALATLLWVVAALALNGNQPDRVWTARGWLGRVLPLPVLTVVLLLYLSVFLPVSDCLTARDEARRYFEPALGLIHEALDQTPTASDAASKIMTAGTYLHRGVLKPLEQAAAADPTNAGPLVELANWNRERWRLFPGERGLREKAVGYARRAQKLDPDGKDGYLAEYYLYVTFARHAKQNAAEQYASAAAALEKAVRLDPTEARLRFLLAEAYFGSGNTVGGRQEAEKAWQRDQEATEPVRKLEPPQREQVRKWLGLPPDA
jgi:hypothetical protein